MNAADLARCTGARIDRAREWLQPLTNAMDRYEINTPARQAAFLAQIGHESGGLHWTVEIWGPTDAQRRYEGRKDLGNTLPGDGFKYRGRGLIQVTGRDNYRQVSAALGVDFIAQPELLGQAPHAADSAAWFWSSRSLNALADVGDFMRLTKRINGGLNGYAERLVLYETAQAVLA